MELWIDKKIEIHPCTEQGLVTLEAKLGEAENEDFFDPDEMSEALALSPFKDVKFSKEMGYAFANYEQKRLHIFKQGKVIIRRANDKADALGTLMLAIKSLLPAVICNRSEPVMACYRGESDSCLDDCQPLKKLIRSETSTVRFWEILKKPAAQFDERRDALRKVASAIRREGPKGKSLNGLVRSEKLAASKLMVESECPLEISTSLSFLAIYENLGEVVEFLSRSDGGRDALQIADMAADALDALADGERDRLEAVQGRADGMLSSSTRADAKEALSGLRNIARAAMKPVLK